MDANGDQWLLTSGGISVIPQPGSGAAFRSLGVGDGARALTARAKFVWQPDPDRVVLVAPG